jgi:hypothetical protein
MMRSPFKQATDFKEDKMTIQTDVTKRPKLDAGPPLGFRTRGSRAAATSKAEFAYADIELPATAKRSDFDLQTVAIVTAIIVFKLSMLGLLLVSI